MQAERKKFGRFLRKRRSCGGQAVAELTACLIVLLIVLLGYFLMSAVTLENVENTITARSKADESARKGLHSSTGKARYIHSWNYGNNDLPFTSDDTVNTGSSLEDTIFIDQLPGIGTLSGVPTETNAAATLSPFNLLLNAANLAEGTSSEDDPLGERGLDSLKHAFKRLFGVGSFHLSDTVFIPTIVSIPEP